MTTNHPTHGPVSLDRLHQISEILSKTAAQSDGGNLGYAMADAVKVIAGAIAAFGAEPVLYAMQGVNLDTDAVSTCKSVVDGWVDEWNQERKPGVPEYKTVPLYIIPPVPVVPDEMYWQDAPVEGSTRAAAYATGWNACRAAMLKSFGNSEQLDEVGSWDNHMNTPTAKPAINTDELLKHIEGMEVSVDVSTCDADAGHRYFGTVTEISELDTARNGYILLVQDAKPNFKPAGNSPATPDGWIPVSERMPEPKRWLALYGQRVFTHGNNIGKPCEEPCVDQGYLGSDGKFYLLNWDYPGDIDDNRNNMPAIATHWMYWEMPAAPQQEVAGE